MASKTVEEVLKHETAMHTTIENAEKDAETLINSAKERAAEYSQQSKAQIKSDHDQKIREANVKADEMMRASISVAAENNKKETERSKAFAGEAKAAVKNILFG